MKCDNGDEVVQEDRFVTVRVGDIKATRKYLYAWHARRAAEGLMKSQGSRLNFFKRLKTDERGRRTR